MSPCTPLVRLGLNVLSMLRALESYKPRYMSNKPRVSAEPRYARPRHAFLWFHKVIHSANRPFPHRVLEIVRYLVTDCVTQGDR